MTLLSDNDDADDDSEDVDTDAEEEEASSIPPPTEEVDRFAYYTTVAVPLSDDIVPASSSSSLQGNSKTEEHNDNNGVVRMQLRCMEALTPVDMLHLANGTQDATGNRLWMGALFFIEAMIRPVPTAGEGGEAVVQLRARSPGCSSEDTEPQQLQQELQQQQQDQLYHLRRELFHNRKVLELGCGTGAALLSLGIVAHQYQQQQQQQYRPPPIPTHITLTDKDPTVLALCRSNCQLNNLFRSTENRRTKTARTSTEDTTDDEDDDEDKDSEKPSPDPTPYCTVRPLDWGSTLAGSNASASSELRDCGAHDTVIATDVIYDLATLQPLFATASSLLQTATKKKKDDYMHNEDQKSRDRTTEDRSSPDDDATERLQRYFVLAHVPRADIACEPQQIQHEIERRILEAAQHYNFIPIHKHASTGTPSNSSSSNSPWHHSSNDNVTDTGSRNTTTDLDRLFKDDQNEDDYALRPKLVRAIFTNHTSITVENENPNDHDDHDVTHQSRDRRNRLLASTEYTYEDLQDCGASMMIFVLVD